MSNLNNDNAIKMGNENNAIPPGASFVLPVPVTNFMHLNFQVAFDEFRRESDEINRAKGFGEPDLLIARFAGFLEGYGGEVSKIFKPLLTMFKQARTGLKLSLIHSELSEALEGVRNGNPPDSHIPEFTSEEAELADAVIRIMGLATLDGCRLGEAIVAKQNYNRSRVYKHGGKAF